MQKENNLSEKTQLKLEARSVCLKRYARSAPPDGCHSETCRSVEANYITAIPALLKRDIRSQQLYLPSASVSSLASVEKKYQRC